MKNKISSIVNDNQVAYINNRFISESGRLTSDVLEITNSVDIEGILMTVDIEKVYVLKTFRFGNDFRNWIEILMKNPEWCVVNGGKTTPYFKFWK